MMNNMNMFEFAFFLLLSVVCIESQESETYTAPTCTPAYRAISQYHTMCRKDHSRVQDWGVSEADIKIILDTHNKHRANTSPPAKDMNKLYWDTELAILAEKWAKSCWGGHDPNKYRSIPGYPHIGQNMARVPGPESQWERAITLWHNEVVDFEYGVGAKDENAVVGHYTQEVLVAATRVGCGFADCGGNYQYYYCNYARGQMDFEVKTPYNKGARCSACPKSCKDGLCDCGGLMCLNGGTYNINDCTCTCNGPWKGKDCGIPDCPKEDVPLCKKKSSWHCKKYANIRDDCPYLCRSCSNCGKTCQNGGVLDTKTCKCDCGAFAKGDTCEQKIPPCDGKVCLNGGKLNTGSCSCLCRGWYKGETCATEITTTTPAPRKYDKLICPKDESVSMISAAECKALPSKGVDQQGICASMGGSYGCGSCKGWASWFPAQYCPVMCGLCAPKCEHSCHYDGEMDDDCNCKCRSRTQWFNDPYLVKLEGKYCEKIVCPDKNTQESKECRCPRLQCDSNGNKFKCPFKCGLCLRS